VAGQLWRVVAVYRVVTLAYAAALIIRDHDRYLHPATGFLILAIMIAWTPITIYCYSRPAWRLPWLIAVDVAVAAALVLSTRLVESAALINSGAPTLPAFWAAAPVLACAVAGGPLAGLAGAAAISLADFAERGALSESTVGSAVLLLIAGGVGGYLVQLGLRAEAAVASAARHEAAIAERERIARGIHDSVLQVLALVSRRGQALGGEAAELGRLAAEQETALRSLVSQPAITGPPGSSPDLRALLDPLSGPAVTVSCPAQPVMVSEAAAQAILAATTEALGNVTRHAGPTARAWVLVEDDGLAVTVTVRDDGTGFAHERLAEAARAGRLGVAQAIVGRLRDVGGEASITSAPGQGTEVELRVRRG
jgi:signal transduction histidine kinase